MNTHTGPASNPAQWPTFVTHPGAGRSPRRANSITNSVIASVSASTTGSAMNNSRFHG